MAGERRGRGLAALALVISLVALGISILAYREVGGNVAWKDHLQALQSTLDEYAKSGVQYHALRTRQAQQQPLRFLTPGKIQEELSQHIMRLET